MEFPGVLKKDHVEILGINWKRSGMGSKFWLPPLEGGETKKLKRGGGKYGAGAGLLKRGAGTFSVVFNFFKVYQFYI